MKNLLMFLGAVLLVGAAACSSSSSNTGNTSLSCQSAGYKACPNDPALTQDEVDACNKCLSSEQAYVTCAANNGITESTTPSCDASGNSQDPTPLTAAQETTLSTNCGSQQNAYLSCIGAVPAGDGGT
jgi:hypothetical protein